ncbi:hypothetical protein [Rubellicoccus peritrichatus]|uniref:Lipoprotein n=1 Tax=Rubellicoccus peritrichatus TaxID=3080537 RepID=A0AAQ3L9U7_9BACT|nr:hypothetical protein [Puniceicoccus sp. CR14]WOO41501.1 hypothetical protein RZN69_00270 [Puniceicoccus sp. CR14]
MKNPILLVIISCIFFALAACKQGGSSSSKITLTDTKGRSIECQILERREDEVDILRTDNGREYTLPIANLSQGSKRKILAFPLVSDAKLRERAHLEQLKRNVKIEIVYDHKTDSITDRSGNTIYTWGDLLTKHGYWYGFVNVSSGGHRQEALDFGVTEYPSLVIDGKVIRLSGIEGAYGSSSSPDGTFAVNVPVFEKNLVEKINEMLLEHE